MTADRVTNWARDYEDETGLRYLESLNGVPWFEAPAPLRRHECCPQTRGHIDGPYVERCACGGVNLGDGYWIERNQRCAEEPARWWQRLRRA